MASLLIIGGSGFFGKSILDAYGREKLKSWGIDSLILLARNAEALKVTNPELLANTLVTLFNEDIATCKTLPQADYVIHAAASADAAAYLSKPLSERENILAGTRNFCNLARLELRNSKILYVSSGAAYGQQPEGLDFITEDYDPGPVEELSIGKRDYAAAKRDSEQLIYLLGRDGLDVSIARCFAFIGKYLPRHTHFAIGNFLENGLRRCDIEVKATTPVFRSYMYADDLVSWLMTIIASSNYSCPTYNVGSDEPIEVRDLAAMIASIYKVGTVCSPLISSKADRYVPSITLASSVLGLKLEFNLIEAIRETRNRIECV